MKFLLMLRKTHEAELDKAINIITEKNRIIAVKKDELEVEKRTKARLQDRNESLHQALTIAEGKLKKLDRANKDLYKANKVLIEGFNSANRSNWCNEESKRQIKKLAEDILEVDKINKNEIASYLLDITKYMGGGMPIDIQVNEEFGK